MKRLLVLAFISMGYSSLHAMEEVSSTRKQQKELSKQLFTLISYAGNHMSEIQELVKKGVSVNDVCDDEQNYFFNKQTPLYRAAEGNYNPELIAYLLKEGADPNALSVDIQRPYRKISPLVILQHYLDNPGKYRLQSETADLKKCIALVEQAGGRYLESNRI